MLAKHFERENNSTFFMCSFVQLFLDIHVDVLSLSLGWPNLKTLSSLFNISYSWFT